jgi:peptide/nickel transport system substrate-binding protein
MARHYLEKSKINLTNTKTDFSFVSTYEEYRLTAFMLLDNLRKIGVALDLKPGLWSTNWDKAKKLETAPNIISMAWWPTVSSPSDWFFSLYHTQENPLFNLSHYSNTVVDSLTQKAWKLESIDPGTAREIYKELQDILIDDCVVVPAVDIKIPSVRKSNIDGFKNNPAYSTVFVYDLSKN